TNEACRTSALLSTRARSARAPTRPAIWKARPGAGALAAAARARTGATPTQPARRAEPRLQCSLGPAACATVRPCDPLRQGGRGPRRCGRARVKRRCSPYRPFMMTGHIINSDNGREPHLTLGTSPCFVRVARHSGASEPRRCGGGDLERLLPRTV